MLGYSTSKVGDSWCVDPAEDVFMHPWHSVIAPEEMTAGDDEWAAVCQREWWGIAQCVLMILVCDHPLVTLPKPKQGLRRAGLHLHKSLQA